MSIAYKSAKLVLLFVVTSFTVLYLIPVFPEQMRVAFLLSAFMCAGVSTGVSLHEKKRGGDWVAD